MTREQLNELEDRAKRAEWPQPTKEEMEKHLERCRLLSRMKKNGATQEEIDKILEEPQ